MRTLQLLALLTSVVVFIGCTGDNTETSGTDEPQQSTEPQQGTQEPVGGPSQPELRKAEAGVGKQGQSLEDEKGVGAVIAKPAATFFAFKQKAIFDFQIPNAMKIFKGNEGRDPESHEEFMEKIIGANRIKLPELKTGLKYVYDPETATLMVGPDK